jgi:flavodoxin
LRKRKALKVLASGLGLAAGVAALVPLSVTWIERRQARDVAPREPYAPAQSAAARTAVVYFSRSGNTALAARHVAHQLGAALFELQAPAYALGLLGWANAMRDARGQQADISPRQIDLKPFDTVLLGSPVWLYSPAPPIWNLMQGNRFDGQRVVLFNTYNSQVKPEFIERFQADVMARGARTFIHLGVRRGRMTQQMTPEAMLRELDAHWMPELRA